MVSRCRVSTISPEHRAEMAGGGGGKRRGRAWEDLWSGRKLVTSGRGNDDVGGMQYRVVKNVLKGRSGLW